MTCVHIFHMYKWNGSYNGTNNNKLTTTNLIMAIYVLIRLILARSFFSRHGLLILSSYRQKLYYDEDDTFLYDTICLRQSICEKVLCECYSVWLSTVSVICFQYYQLFSLENWIIRLHKIDNDYPSVLLPRFSFVLSRQWRISRM